MIAPFNVVRTSSNGAAPHCPAGHFSPYRTGRERLSQTPSSLSRNVLITVPHGSSRLVSACHIVRAHLDPGQARRGTDRGGRRRRSARHWRRYGGGSRRTTGTPPGRHTWPPCRSRIPGCHQASASSGLPTRRWTWPTMLFSGAPCQPASPAGTSATTAGMFSRSVAIAIWSPFHFQSCRTGGRHRFRCHCLPGRSGRAPR